MLAKGRVKPIIMISLITQHSNFPVFTGFPQGKSRLGRDKLTSACWGGDNFAFFFVLLLFMLCYSFTQWSHLKC